MPETAERADRPLEEIEKDFADLMASRLPVWIARDKFERLWDETNVVAAQLMLTTHGRSYISLLKRMHETFESRYAEVPVRTTIASRRS